MHPFSDYTHRIKFLADTFLTGSTRPFTLLLYSSIVEPPKITFVYPVFIFKLFTSIAVYPFTISSRSCTSLSVNKIRSSAHNNAYGNTTHNSLIITSITNNNTDPCCSLTFTPEALLSYSRVLTTFCAPWYIARIVLTGHSSKPSFLQTYFPTSYLSRYRYCNAITLPHCNTSNTFSRQHNVLLSNLEQSVITEDLSSLYTTVPHSRCFARYKTPNPPSANGVTSVNSLNRICLCNNRKYKHHCITVTSHSC